MSKILIFCIAISSWLAVIIQYDLMLANRANSVLETTIRFFSFFTILTNSIVAVYFSYLTYNYLKNKKAIHSSLGTLTAITVYITIVGLVYQIILRHTWNPTGTQKIVDELLHSVNPILVIVYWFLNQKNSTLKYQQIPSWLLFPLVYLIYVLIRGYYSNFFPYPFLNLTNIGLIKVVVNIIIMTTLFTIISMLFIWIAKWTTKNRKIKTSP
ncbi:Pr6Pr family membrane protein [Flavobacterium pedocola]